MSSAAIRPAYVAWPEYNRRLRDTVEGLTVQQLACKPSPDRWPLWATIGHIACQRISWLCGIAGEPGAEATPFPDALHSCPGDEDLEHVLGPAALAAALDATFAIVERCLDTWAFDSLETEHHRTLGHETITWTRGAVISRVFAHDVAHTSEVNEILAGQGIPQVPLWD